MITLRPYQEQARISLYNHLRQRDDNPCIVIPTAGGKTPLMASICKDVVNMWNGRVVVIAHVKELLEQTAEKLRTICPEVDFGIYSAGMKRRDTSNRVIVAGIQSVHRHACDLGPFDLLLVDEAHLIPPDSDSMYQRFLSDARTVNPSLRIAGFTATPYRLKTGSICSPDGVLNHICFSVGVRELIRDGYLCPLITKSGRTKVDTDRLHIRAGEFVANELENLMDQDSLVNAACQEIVEQTATRNACLIFASGLIHGRHIVEVLEQKFGLTCGFVCGNTASSERSEILDAFRGGRLKYLCNVGVLTTGFDAPHIDCVAMLRPTLSAGLYYQMTGRGFRLHPSKQDCLVLDFGGNVLRHGPVDQIEVVTRNRGEGNAPAKECPACQALIATGYSVCPQCGHVFPPPDRQKHDSKASEAGILSGQATVAEYPVQDITYSVHRKRNAPLDAPKCMRVDYVVGLNHTHSEFICIEHDGYARMKAESWWKLRSPDPIPLTAEKAVQLAYAGSLAFTEKITVRSVAGEKYDRIVAHKLGPVPEAVETSDFITFDDDEVPF